MTTPSSSPTYRTGDVVQLRDGIRLRSGPLAPGTRLHVQQVEQSRAGQRLTLLTHAQERVFLDAEKVGMDLVARDEMDGAFDRVDVVVMKTERSDGSETCFSGIVLADWRGFLITFARTSNHWDATIQVGGRIVHQGSYGDHSPARAELLMDAHVLQSAKRS